MQDGIEARIEGLDDVVRELRAMPNKVRQKALLPAMRAGGRVVRDAARSAAPVMSQEEAAKRPYRTRGLVRRRIVVRTSKLARRRGDVGVFVNVRPAKAGQRGAKNRNDPYYWKWLEFGKAGKHSARPVRFLQGSASSFPEALRAIVAAAGPAIQKLNRPGP